MKDIIFDNLPSLNINLIKNKCLKACSSMPTNMPMACTSFIKMVQQCFYNIIFGKNIVDLCFAACQRTPVLIGFDHNFHLQARLQEKGMGKDYMQYHRLAACTKELATTARNRYIVDHCCYNICMQ